MQQFGFKFYMCNIVARKIYNFQFLVLIKFKSGSAFLQTKIIIHKLLIFIRYFLHHTLHFFMISIMDDNAF
jgi:hypothetical protein